MYVLFEESGQFKTASILSEADTSLQVETSPGKRNKIKRNNVIFTFKDDVQDTLLAQAEALSSDIDVEFLWEICPKETFNAEQLAREYYGANANIIEQTALLLRLHEHPIYFHRKGKGLFAAAPKEILQAALLAQEKKRQQELQQQAWADEMIQGKVPDEIRDVLPSFIQSPDKNSLAWKAFQTAMQATNLQVAELLLKLHVFPHELAIHRALFFSKYFPKGTDNPKLPIPEIEELPKASVTAFSVDDVDTTEIDDAFSIQAINETVFTFGIHIACPALVIDRDSPLDLAARQRMSTVYFPSEKIPMQEQTLIDRFSLNEGKYAPALSLYVTANILTGEILNKESKLEQVFIQANLRIPHIEPFFTQEALEDPLSDIPHAELFKPMWALTKHLRQARDEFRGKPEGIGRVEYLFKLDGAPDDPNAKLKLTPRLRTSPLDMMVAEFMILCNSSWAALLHELGLPGIFRSQRNGQVRMGTHALPHDNIGVPHYAWTSSPLRRYVDLFNQRQLIAGVKHGISARLVAPYKPKDPDIFTIISSFESCHTNYLDAQNKIERYWCLRYIQQNAITRTTATVLRDELIRFADLPLVVPIAGLINVDKGTLVEVDILSIDLYNLTIECRIIH